MSILSSSHFLRNVLRADAISCVASGALQLLFTGLLARLLGLPEPLLLGTGAFLVVYAAAVAFISTREPIPRAIVWLLVAGNALWALGCVALLLGNAAAPTLLGQAYVLVQALIVAVLAELQYFGLRRNAPRWDAA